MLLFYTVLVCVKLDFYQKKMASGFRDVHELEIVNG